MHGVSDDQEILHGVSSDKEVREILLYIMLDMVTLFKIKCDHIYHDRSITCLLLQSG